MQVGFRLVMIFSEWYDEPLSTFDFDINVTRGLQRGDVLAPNNVEIKIVKRQTKLVFSIVFIQVYISKKKLKTSVKTVMSITEWRI